MTTCRKERKYLDKKFKDMTRSELNLSKQSVETVQLSPFAKFCRESRGYNYETKKGSILCKYEVWAMGYTNAANIIAGITELVAKVKTEDEY